MLGINNISRWVLATVMLSALWGCKDETWDNGEKPQEVTYGILSLNDLNIEVVNSTSVDSRYTPDVNNFIVEIFKNGELYRSFSSYGSMPSTVQLPVGNYTLTARSGDVVAAGWHVPYFEGSNVIAISEGQNSLGTIQCRLSNIKVTVELDDKLRELVSSDTHVDVAYQNEEDLSKILTYGLTQIDERHEGYFEYITGGKTLIATFYGTVDGESTVKEFPCTNLSAGQHQIVSFSIKDQNADDPNQGEEPGDDDPSIDNPGNDDDPSIDNPGNDDDNPGEDNPGEDNPGGEDDPGDDDPGNGDDNHGGEDNPGDDNNQGGEDNPGDDEPSVDETIGSFTLSNGLTINVSIRTVDLRYTLKGEEDPTLGGVLRPGDPGYTGDEDPSVNDPGYGWKPDDGDNDPDEGDKNPNEGDNSGDANDPNNPNEGENTPPEQEDPTEQEPPVDEPDDPEPVHTVGFESEYMDLTRPNPAEDFGTEPGQKPAILVIKASAGIAHIHVKIDSPALPPDELRGIGLTSEFDLAYPGDYDQGLRDLGFVTKQDVIGKTSVNFDATEFIPLLIILNTPGTHHFIITVVDVQDEPLSETLDLRFVTE